MGWFHTATRYLDRTQIWYWGFTAVSGVLSWLAKQTAFLEPYGWPEAIFAGIFAACAIIFVVSLGLIAYSLFRAKTPGSAETEPEVARSITAAEVLRIIHDNALPTAAPMDAVSETSMKTAINAAVEDFRKTSGFVTLGRAEQAAHRIAAEVAESAVKPLQDQVFSAIRVLEEKCASLEGAVNQQSALISDLGSVVDAFVFRERLAKELDQLEQWPAQIEKSWKTLVADDDGRNRPTSDALMDWYQMVSSFERHVSQLADLRAGSGDAFADLVERVGHAKAERLRDHFGQYQKMKAVLAKTTRAKKNDLGRRNSIITHHKAPPEA